MSIYQPSINIKYDLGKAELFNMFVPNTSQLSIIASILEGILKSEEKSHTIVGPYGAGKSLVGALTGTLLTANKRSKVTKQFIEDVKLVTPSMQSIYEDLLLTTKQRWLPIAITGRSGDFEDLIITSITEQLHEHGIEIAMQTEAKQMQAVITRWRDEYPSTYQQFTALLTQEVATFEESLLKEDEQTMEQFKSYYSELTAGAVFVAQHEVPFIEQIENISKQLQRKKVGIVIIFDEFGRFLQSVASNNVNTTMQAIQDLAEFVNRSNNIGLITITHTGLQQYFANTSFDKEELERVIKRFVEHRLESDSATFYRAAHKMLVTAKSYEISDAYIEQEHHNIAKYNLFPELTPEEREGAIIKGCYPVHSLAISMLPALSNTLGQNDRTLYAFLANFSKIAPTGNRYHVDELFSYFYPDQATLYAVEELKYYRLAASYKLTPTSMAIVKAITLLNIVNSPYLVDVAFLSYALGSTENEVQQAIDELERTKLLRFNIFAETYELYIGSAVDIATVCEQRKIATPITVQLREKALTQTLDTLFYLPYKYNNLKSMTRFITNVVKINPQEDLLSTSLDGELVYALFTDEQRKNNFITKIESQSSKILLYCISQINTAKFIDLVDDYIILEMLAEDKELLASDANLKVELAIEIQSKRYEIKREIDKLQQFKASQQWFSNGQELPPFTSQIQLEDWLSDKMFEQFAHTPVIRNEMFNKANIPNVQRKAAITTLDTILEETFDGTFETKGFGPDYLLQATVLKRQGYDCTDFTKLTPELQEVRSRLLQHIEENPKGKILDLFMILLGKDFGIRPPLVPLLVGALLKDRWGEMVFYSNGFAVYTLTAENLYDILEQKVTMYEYEVYELNEQDKATLTHLNELFFSTNVLLQPNRLFNKLIGWLRELPKFTQLTVQQSELAIEFKEAIRLSEVDALLALQQLQAFTLNQLQEVKRELEQFIPHIKAIIQEQAIEALGLYEDNSEALEAGMRNSPEFAKIVELWRNEQDWLAYSITQLVSIQVEDWSDVTHETYLTTLLQIKDITHEDDAIRIIVGDQVINTVSELELSTKGKVIYNQVSRIIGAGGRTLTPDEVKYILFKVLQEQ